MSCWPETLQGTAGVLMVVRVRVQPRNLEDVLEALASADFPINPEIRHGHAESTVEFPAYDKQLTEIRTLLKNAGIEDTSLDIANMLRTIAR